MSEAGERPGIGRTMLMLVGAVIFTLGILTIYGLLGISLPHFGFLFMLFWAAIQRQDFGAYFPTLVGGLLGIGLGWMLTTLPGMIGLPGTVAAFAALAIVLFLFMRGQARFAVNEATMLFLTVATLGPLDIGRNVGMICASLAVGAIYMGGVSGILYLISKRRMSAG